VAPFSALVTLCGLPSALTLKNTGDS